MLQKDLGEEANMEQSAVSRIEQSEYSGWSFKTLLRVADALDARLRILLEPAEDVIEQYERFESTQEQSLTQYTTLHDTLPVEANFNLIVDPSREEMMGIYPEIIPQTGIYSQGAKA